MADRRKQARTDRIVVEARLLDAGPGESGPELVAYLFGQGGRLLGQQAVKQGRADLSVPKLKEPERLRVMVGPAMEGEDSGRLLSNLTRLDAPIRSVRSDQIEGLLQIDIDRVLWGCWLRTCSVRGRLLKRLDVDGMTYDLPVCGAEVEIYEVDPVQVVLPRIPDWVLDRIRQIVLRPLPWPPPIIRRPPGIPFPPQPPGPGPDPAPYVGAFEDARSALAPLEPAAMPPVPTRQELTRLVADIVDESAVRADAVSEGPEAEVRRFEFASGEARAPTAEMMTGALQALAETDAIRMAAGTDLAAFRSALLQRPELLRPVLCWLWPAAVTYQLVATVTTDECGTFRAGIYVGCSSDQPDLYFRAYRRFGTLRLPLYDPAPIACHTWWNYACGSEVTLFTTSPFAPTCSTCVPVIAPDHWVLAMAVGNTSLAAIHGTGPDISSAPPGQTGANSAWGEGAAFGGSLRLRFEFDHSLRSDVDVRYYRVRWRKVGSGNPWLDLDGAVWRHYAHWVGPTLAIEPYKLGPQPVGSTPNLYEIPPAVAPVGQWIIADAVVDTTSAIFPSAALAPAGGGEGLYEFELTLFKADGSQVDAASLAALGINYRIPRTVDLTTTIDTADASTLGLVAGGRLVYRLRVDNNACVAGIDAPTLGGSAAADDCGLLRYGAAGDAMELGYLAAQPNGFARYQFDVHRGAIHLAAVSQPSGPGTLPVGSAPWTHAVATSAGQLLGTCTIAGFAETLYVYAHITNGWSRQHHYDASRVRAFALAPVGA
jgi:hypothetical protein